MSNLLSMLGWLKPKRRQLGSPLFRVPLRWAVSRGWVSDYYVSGIPVENPFRVLFPSGEQFLYSLTDPEGIGEALYWKGAISTEPDVAHVFRDYARRATGFIDVGANTGFYSMLAHAANQKIRIWAFEPNPAVYRKLEHHILINKMEASCQPYAMALGEVAGAVKLQIPADATMAHVVGDGEEGIEVPIQPLDAVISPRDKVDLVKIDVEGHELAVFREAGAGHHVFQILPVHGGPERLIVVKRLPVMDDLFKEVHVFVRQTQLQVNHHTARP